MKTEVNPQDTNRAEAFELWMSSPMPMVTLTKTFDVSNLIKVSRKAGVKFNALLCWCIGKAATQTEEFYILPENGKLFQYDCIAVNVIVNNREGGINSCDIPFTDDLKAFLHIEAIPGGASVPKGQQLQFQMDTFRRIIRQNANRRGMKITFIHGIGDGILKAAIRKELDEVLALRCSYSVGDPAVTVVSIK